MRRHIKSQKVLEILDGIEARLGYAVEAKPFDFGVGEGHQAITTCRPKIACRYDPAAVEANADEIFAHELMHIHLYLEGWPRLQLSDAVPDQQFPCLSAVAARVAATLADQEIFQRLDRAGLLNLHFYKEKADSLFADFERDPATAVRWGQFDPIGLTGLHLCPLLRWPYPPGIERRCRDLGLTDALISAGLHTANQILLLFDAPEGVRQANCLQAAQDIFQLIGLPKEYLTSVPAEIPA